MEGLTLRRAETALVVIDVQEKLAAAMPQGEIQAMVANVVRLVEGAAVLGLPVLVTEQYPQGLGPTVGPVREALSRLQRPAHVVEKLEFDATRCRGFASAVDEIFPARGARLPTFVVAGMESHICVYQTARGLAEQRFAVHVAQDATCSRSIESKRAAEMLYRYSGAIVSTTETILFDLLGTAASDEFKAISRLVR